MHILRFAPCTQILARPLAIGLFVGLFIFRFCALVTSGIASEGAPGNDFDLLYGAGKAAAVGGNPHVGNVNGPAIDIVLQAFASLPFSRWEIFWLWTSMSILLYSLAVGLLVARYRRWDPLVMAAWCLGVEPLWGTLNMGQVYTWLMLLGTVVWLLLNNGRCLLAGIPLGLLAAIKPPFAAWALILFAAGHRRTAASAAVTAVLATVLPMMVYGPRVLWQWIDMATDSPNLTITAVMLSNMSLPSYMAKLGAPQLGPLVGIMLLAATVVWAWRGRQGVLQASGVGICVSLLASPISWPGYALLLMPVFFSYQWRPAVALAGIAFTIPFAVLDQLALVAPVYFALITSVYPVTLLVLIVHLFAQSADGQWRRVATNEADPLVLHQRS